MDLRSFVLKWIPKWASLRAAGNSPPVKLTPIVPIIGYLILFNEYFIGYSRLAMELGIDKAGAVQISDRLLLLYLGLTALAVGSLIYSWKCPDEIKHHATSRAYIAADGASIGRYAMDSIEDLLRDGEFSRAYSEIRDKFDVEPGMFHGSPEMMMDRYESSYKEIKLACLHLYYNRMDNKDPAIRLCVAVFFLSGFSLLMVVAIPVFVRVSWIAFQRWL
jgi:hypothetical protein